MRIPLAVSAIISASQATQLFSDPITSTGAFGEVIKESQYEEFIHKILDFPSDNAFIQDYAQQTY